MIGRRGQKDSQWSWEPQAGKRAGRRIRVSRRAVLIAAAAALAVTAAGAGIALLLLSGGGNHRNEAVLGQSASPSAAGPLVLALWNSGSARWQTSDLAAGASPLAEGQEVLFLLRIEGTSAGATYEGSIGFSGCGVPPGEGFDYLTAGTVDDRALLTPGSPGRTQPDSLGRVPDEADVSVDNGRGPGLVRIWGGTLAGTPAWATAPSDCPGARKLIIPILARVPTLFLVWTAHLASGSDWVGQGAAAGQSAIMMVAGVAGAGEQALRLAQGSVRR